MSNLNSYKLCDFLETVFRFHNAAYRKVTKMKIDKKLYSAYLDYKLPEREVMRTIKVPVI